MPINAFLDLFRNYGAATAIISNDREVSYDWLVDRIAHWNFKFKGMGLASNRVISIEAEFSAESVALFFALVENRAIIVPLSNSVRANKEEFLRVAEVSDCFEVTGKQEI